MLEDYIKSLGENKEIQSWINAAGAKALNLQKTTESELEHIVDFLFSDKAPVRLRKMSFKDAKRKTQEWMEANQKKGRNLSDSEDDIETVLSFKDGSSIVKLKTENAYGREGFLMNHCLGGYSLSSNMDIYSYRDKDNNPHATFEIRKECDEINQIKGKGNGPIHPKYIEPVLSFLEFLEMNIRSSEMKHLGYYHINKDHVDFLKNIPTAWKQVVEIRGEYYAF